MLYATPSLTADDRRVLAEIDEFYTDFERSTGGSKASEWLVQGVGYGTTLRYVAVGELKRAHDEVSAAVTAPPVEPYPA
jgi:hypothetical protein